MSSTDTFHSFSSMYEFGRSVSEVQNTTPPYDGVWKQLDSNKRTVGGVNIVNLRGIDMETWNADPENIYIGRMNTNKGITPDCI